MYRTTIGRATIHKNRSRGVAKKGKKIVKQKRIECIEREIKEIETEELKKKKRAAKRADKR